jgi:hypothetical protein
MSVLFAIKANNGNPVISYRLSVMEIFLFLLTIGCYVDSLYINIKEAKMQGNRKSLKVKAESPKPKLKS